MLLTALDSAITLDQYLLGLGGIFTARQLKKNQWVCPLRILTKILSLSLIDSSLFAVHPVDCVKLLRKCCQPSTGVWIFFCQVVALCTIKETKKKYSLNNRISSLLCWRIFRSNFSLQLCTPGVLCRCCQVPCCRMRIIRCRLHVSPWMFSWVKARLWLGHSRTNAQMLIGTFDSVSVLFAPPPQHDAAITVLHHRDHIGQMMSSVWFPLNRKFRFEDKRINCGFLWPEILVYHSLRVQGVFFSFSNPRWSLTQMFLNYHFALNPRLVEGCFFPLAQKISGTPWVLHDAFVSCDSSHLSSEALEAVSLACNILWDRGDKWKVIGWSPSADKTWEVFW